MSSRSRTASRKASTSAPKFGYTNPEYLSSKQKYDVGTIVSSADRDAEDGMQIANNDECQTMSVIDNALGKLLNSSQRYITLLSQTAEGTENYKRLNDISTKTLLAINKLYRKKELCNLRQSNPELQRYESLTASFAGTSTAISPIVGSFSGSNVSSVQQAQPEDASIYATVLKCRVERTCGFKKFDHIVGRTDIKSWFSENFVARYKFPQFQKALQMTQSVLVYGPTGTGKSSIAEAFAGELESLKASLYCVSATDINTMYNRSKNAIKILFEVITAATKGSTKKVGEFPVIVCIDDFDKLSQESGAMNEFMRQYDALIESKVTGIILVAAATHVDVIPLNVVSKLFTTKYYFGLPTKSEIREMMINFLNKITWTRFNLKRVDLSRKTHVTDMAGFYDAAATALSRKVESIRTKTAVEESLRNTLAERFYDDVDIFAESLYDYDYAHKDIEAVLKYADTLSEGRAAKFFSESISSGGTKVEYHKWILDRHRMNVDEIDQYGVCVRQKEVSKYSFIPLYPTVFNNEPSEELALREKFVEQGGRLGVLYNSVRMLDASSGTVRAVSQKDVPKYDLEKNIRVVVTERTMRQVKTSRGTENVWTYRIVRRQEKPVATLSTNFAATEPYTPTAQEDVSDRMSTLIAGCQIDLYDIGKASAMIKPLPIKNAAKYIEYAENFGVKLDDLEKLRLQRIQDEEKQPEEKTAALALAEALLELTKKKA